LIPYLGCKQRWAKEFLRILPDAENFYDLFGGGGSVTEAAFKMQENGLFGQWKKWPNLHYNDINRGVYLLNKEVWEGTFDFEFAKDQTPSKERYYEERRKPNAWGAFVSYVWSFGNKDESFMYSDCSNTLRSNEHLQRLRRIERSPKIPNVTLTNEDYRAVTIKSNSVVYCDIPYNLGYKCHYRCKFDFQAFYEWAESSKHPVYFSDYSLPNAIENKFPLVWEKCIPVKINTKLTKNKALYKTEKIYWNGKRLRRIYA